LRSLESSFLNLVVASSCCSMLLEYTLAIIGGRISRSCK
jgi:hypothetical protein